MCWSPCLGRLVFILPLAAHGWVCLGTWRGCCSGELAAGDLRPHLSSSLTQKEPPPGLLPASGGRLRLMSVCCSLCSEACLSQRLSPSVPCVQSEPELRQTRGQALGGAPLLALSLLSCGLAHHDHMQPWASDAGTWCFSGSSVFGGPWRPVSELASQFLPASVHSPFPREVCLPP